SDRAPASGTEAAVKAVGGTTELAIPVGTCGRFYRHERSPEHEEESAPLASFRLGGSIAPSNSRYPFPANLVNSRNWLILRQMWPNKEQIATRKKHVEPYKPFPTDEGFLFASQ